MKITFKRIEVSPADVCDGCVFFVNDECGLENVNDKNISCYDVKTDINYIFILDKIEKDNK